MKTLFARAIEFSRPIVLKTFREVRKKGNYQPSKQTSAKKVIEIYQKVGIAFRKEAGSRNERIPVSNLNWIVFKYITLDEMFGDKLLEEHLTHEIEKYQREGTLASFKFFRQRS